MRVITLFAMCVALPGCGGTRSDRADEPTSINELANQLEPQLNSGLEKTKDAIKAEVKQKCGTSLIIPDVPKIVRGEVYAAWVEPSATADQIACAQQIDPDFKAAPK